MDATEEGDVALQRASSELLSELGHCIPKFLYRRSLDNGKELVLRHAVRRSAVGFLIKLVSATSSFHCHHANRDTLRIAGTIPRMASAPRSAARQSTSPFDQCFPKVP